jgi:hypothetical protein
MIRKAEIMKSAKVLKSNMFLVKKYLADGSFDKVKATSQSKAGKSGMVQLEIDGRLSYLGMEIEVTDEGTHINMSFYVKQMLENAEEKMELVEYASPGTKEMFVVDEKMHLLPQNE